MRSIRTGRSDRAVIEGETGRFRDRDSYLSVVDNVTLPCRFSDADRCHVEDHPALQPVLDFPAPY